MNLIILPIFAAAILAASHLAFKNGLDKYVVSYRATDDVDTSLFKVYVIPYNAMAIFKKLKMTADRVIAHGWNGDFVELIIANRGVDPTTINASLSAGYHPIKSLTKTDTVTIVSHAIPEKLQTWLFAQMIDSLRLFGWIGDYGVNYVAQNVEFNTTLVPTGVLYAEMPGLELDMTPLSETGTDVGAYLGINVKYGDSYVRLAATIDSLVQFSTDERVYVIGDMDPTQMMMAIENNMFDAANPVKAQGIDFGDDVVVTMLRWSDNVIAVGTQEGLNFVRDVLTGEVETETLPGPIVSKYTAGETLIVDDRTADHLTRLAVQSINPKFAAFAGFNVTPVTETPTTDADSPES